MAATALTDDEKQFLIKALHTEGVLSGQFEQAALLAQKLGLFRKVRSRRS